MSDADASGLILPALGLALGATTGAFGATLAIRRAENQPVGGRSRCDGCGRTLAFYETVPVLSFIALRGRCRTCAHPIDRIHLWGELGGALLLAAVLALRPFPQSLIEAALAAVLWILALVDMRTRTLPNLIVAMAAGFGAILAWLDEALWLNLGLAVAMTAIFGLLAFGMKRLRGRTMLGAGDVKLIGALTLWLGADVPLALIVACVLGLLQIAIRRSRDGAIAFGPPLVAGSLVVGLVVMPQFRLLEA
jgi:leader peptidase (prepilin peptidase)/N-methyltransferase